MKTVNVRDDLVAIQYFHFFDDKSQRKQRMMTFRLLMKTEKISGKLMAHIPLT